jgi:hypothetical protein
MVSDYTMLYAHLPTHIPTETFTKSITVLRAKQFPGLQKTEKTRHYRLTAATLALTQSDHRRVMISLPAGSILKTPAERANATGLVTVEWDGKAIQIFAADLVERGEMLQEETTGAVEQVAGCN